MEAPGYTFHPSTGDLQRLKPNTNDGKRSEWGDFLRQGDTVQLCIPTSILLSVISGLNNTQTVQVVTDYGQKLGAEPKVVASIEFP